MRDILPHSDIGRLGVPISLGAQPSASWEPPSASIVNIARGWLGVTALTVNMAVSESSFYLDGSNGSEMESISFPKLATNSGELVITNFTSLTSISVPLLEHSADLVAQGSAALSILSCDSLQTIDGDLSFPGTSLVSVSFPSLVSANVVTGGTTNFSSCAALTSFSAPLLQTAQAIDLSNTIVDTVDLTSLQSLTQFFNFGGYINLRNVETIVSISLPALTGIVTGSSSLGPNPALDFNGCESLTDVSIPLLASINGNVDFFDCALTETSVNHILARLVVCGFVGTVDLSGGTNAAPTGQGVTDVATLTGLGATVTTN